MSTFKIQVPYNQMESVPTFLWMRVLNLMRDHPVSAIFFAKMKINDIRNIPARVKRLAWLLR